MELQTERLLLRSFTCKDGDVLRKIAQEKNADPAAKWDLPWPSEREGLQGLLDWIVEQETFLAVFPSGDASAAGFVTLNPAGNEREWNLGYFLSPRCRGRGYAKEACTALLRVAFEKLGADRIVAGTVRENQSSVRLLESLGFREAEISPAVQADSPVEGTACFYVLDRATRASSY
jgi:RimJ/RimL family protein N-acetyltransferase